MSRFSLRLMLVICSVLFAFVAGRDGYVLLSTSAVAFIATMTLLMVVLGILLQ